MATARVTFSYLRVIPSRVPGRMYDVFLGIEIPWSSIEWDSVIQYGETTSGPWVDHDPDDVDPDIMPDFSADYSELSEQTISAFGVGPIRSDPVYQIAVRAVITATNASLSAAGLSLSDFADWQTGHKIIGISEAVSPDHLPSERDYRRLSELIRRENVALFHETGFPGAVIKIRKVSYPCPRCAPKGLSESPSDSRCPVCHGTGRAHPWHTPQKILINWIDNKPSGNQNRPIVQDGRENVDKFVIRTLPVPEIGTDDIIVDGGTGTRFRVTACDPDTFGVWPYAQNATLVSIGRTDPVYSVAVPDLHHI